MTVERKVATHAILKRIVQTNARQLITAAGRQSTTWKVGSAKRIKDLVDGCNWTILIDAPVEVRKIAQPAIDEARRKYNLKAERKSRISEEA